MSLYDDVLVKKRQKETKEALAVEAFRTCLDELCEEWAEDACRKIKQEMLLLEKRGSASGVIHYYAPFAADLSTEQARRYLPFAPTYSEDYYIVDDVVFDLWGKRVVLKCFNEFGYSSVGGAQGNRCGTAHDRCQSRRPCHPHHRLRQSRDECGFGHRWCSGMRQPGFV